MAFSSGTDFGANTCVFGTSAVNAHCLAQADATQVSIDAETVCDVGDTVNLVSNTVDQAGAVIAGGEEIHLTCTAGVVTAQYEAEAAVVDAVAIRCVNP